eukprot:SAG22_NODE_1155_length_5341_cov_12.348531_2_plen_330_part_00
MGGRPPPPLSERSWMYLCSPPMVAAAAALIGYGGWVELRHILPAKAADRSRPWGSPGWTVSALTTAVMLGNLTYNYVRTVMADPGTVDSVAYRKLVDEERRKGGPGFGGLGSEAAVRVEAQMAASDDWRDRGGYDWAVCRHSGKLKPPRAHFDHVTGKLVLNMDHYCPWMCNVVGYGNYRFFSLTLYQILLFSAFLAADAAIVSNRASTRKRMTPGGLEAALLIQSIGLGVGVGLSPLIGLHAYLMGTGQTTIEYFGNPPDPAAAPRSQRQRAAAREGRRVAVSPYSTGLVGNWRLVFGTSWIGSDPITALLLPHFGGAAWPPYPPDED